MLFRSTGLGKTEMAADIEKIEHQGDYLIMRVRSTDPVVWKIRVALNFHDIAVVLKSAISISVIGFILSPAQWFKKKAKHPGDF
jgi:hypothetical protein